MHTRCPHCQTIFNVSAEQLRLAHGMVRCGQCMGTFDGLVDLSEEGLGDPEAPVEPTPPEEPVATVAQHGDRVLLRTIPQSRWTVAVPDSPPEQSRSESDFADTVAELYQKNLASTYPEVLPEAESIRQDLQPEEVSTPYTKPQEPAPPAEEKGDERGDVSGAVDHEQSAGREEFDPAHEEFDAAHEEFDAAHEEVSAAHEEVSAAHEEVSAAHEEVSAGHEEVSAGHEEVSAGHEEVSAGHEEISAAQEEVSAGHEEISAAQEEVSAEVIEQVGTIIPSFSTDSSEDEIGEPIDIETLRSFEAQVEASRYGDPLEDSLTEQPGHTVSADEAEIQDMETEPSYPKVLEDDIQRLHQLAARAKLRKLFAVLSVGLLVVMGLQYAWFMPEDMASRYPQTRDFLDTFCGHAGCSLAEQSDPAQVQVVSPDVRVHPKYEGALLVTAQFVNAANFVQPYPLMEFTLFNVNGQTIATRTFTPEQYVGRGVDIGAGMTPSVPTQIELDVLAPEEAAVSFEFRFL